jgi:acetyl-CoA carboxylase carboxyl transferase subunit alpha
LQLSQAILLKFGIVEEILPEPLGDAHHNPDAAFASTKEAILPHLKTLKRFSHKQLLEKRYARFRHVGIFSEQK